MIEQDKSDPFKVVKLAKRPQQPGVKLVMPEGTASLQILDELAFTKADVKPAGPHWEAVDGDDWPLVGSDGILAAPTHDVLWNKFWSKLWDEVEKEAIREERRLQTERSRNQEATRLLLLALEASHDPKN